MLRAYPKLAPRGKAAMLQTSASAIDAANQGIRPASRAPEGCAAQAVKALKIRFGD